MKHIIVEGVDRCGKSTLIDYIKSIAKTIDTECVINEKHFGTPVGNTNQEKIDYQKSDFELQFCNVLESALASNNSNDIYLWDRSHIGEFVYGNMYRNYDPSWIFELENRHSYNSINNVYLILMIGDPAFLIKNEDGLSLSNKIENRQKEISLFLDAVSNSHIKNKLIIDVTTNDQYRPLNEIQKSVKEFLNL